MPSLHIEWYEGRTKETKAEVARVLTEDLVRILNCKPEAVAIIFEDVKKENWARAGVLVSDQAK